MNWGIYRFKILMLLLAMIFLTSCIKERFKLPYSEKEVAFSLGNGTRAATGHPIDNVPGAGNQDKGVIPDGYSFGVYAWEKPDNTNPIVNFAALQNMEVTHVVTSGGDTYPYSPVADWPVNSSAQLSFMAYYPWTDQTTPTPNPEVTHGAGSDQSMTLNYTVSANSGEHVDLMYARKSLTSGYDPVNMVFGHALARLMFEACIDGFPGSPTVKITGISITGATLKGELEVLDPAAQPGNPEWTLDNGVTGIITMPPTHIENLTLTGTLQSVMKTEGPTGINGDMLVLPQELAGLKLVVEATWDGVPFENTFDLDGMSDWEMNEITVYEITLKPQGKDLTARVLPWGEVPGEIIIDQQYPLSVLPERLYFGYEGGGMDLTLSTGYDKDDRGFDPGIYIDPPAGGFPSWLNIANIYGANGYLNRVVNVIAEPNETGPARSAKFTIRAGNLNYTYNVVQYPKVAPRITWNPNANQYAITYDPRDAGLYFKFGSVVGAFSGAGAFTQKLPGNSNGTVFDAGVHLPWNPTDVTGTSTTGWNSVPSYTSSMYWDPVSVVHTVANVKNGVGDPCRLVGLDLNYIKNTPAGSLTTFDIDNYTWRLPTNDENQTFSGSTGPVLTGAWWWDANDVNNIAYNIAGGEFPTKGSGGPSKFLPAAGFLLETTGEIYSQEEYGYYWSGNPNNIGFIDVFYMWFYNYYLNPSAIQSYSVGLPVRCVYDLRLKGVLLQRIGSGDVPVGNTVSLSATTTPAGVLGEVNYIWQYFDGMDWVTIEENTTNTFDAPVLKIGPAANEYRVIAYNSNGSVTSNSVFVTGDDVLRFGTTPNIPVIAGAFWRAGETGERIIRVNVGASGLNNTGNWQAMVSWLDDQWDENAGDGVRLSLSGLDAPGLAARNINWNATTTPLDAELFKLTEDISFIFGTVPENGYIEFRIGLKTPYSASAAHPARYGIVLLNYGNNIKSLKIFLRQGEDPDYLMRPEDFGGGGDSWGSPPRPDAKKFSPYNLKDPQNREPYSRQSVERLPLNGATFTEFPTQTGYIFPWNMDRWAFPPFIGTINGWNDPQYQPNYWSSSTNPVPETCPVGYSLTYGTTGNFRRPNDGSITGPGANTVTGSEMRQSLLLYPQNSDGDNTDNSIWSFYADGFYDRRWVTNTVSTEGTTFNTAAGGTIHVASSGRLFINPNNNASIFFPAGGRGASENGAVTLIGQVGAYWTSTAQNIVNQSSNSFSYYFYFEDTSTENWVRMQTIIPSSLLNIRCVME